MEREDRQPESTTSRGVLRAVAILDYVLQRNGAAPVADIVHDLDIPKSTAYELVRTLVKTGCLERELNGSGYGLGRRLYEYGMAYRNQIDLLKQGNHVVEQLRDETGETAQLSVLDGGQMLVLAKEESSHPIRIISRIGSRVPVNWAAAGRLLVSDMDDATLRRLLEQVAQPSPTGRAITNVEALIVQIREFRANGYGIELNEVNEHAGCIAAPVIDGTRECIAAISLVVPEVRLGNDNTDRLIAAVKNAAGELSQRLGGLP